MSFRLKSLQECSCRLARACDRGISLVLFPSQYVAANLRCSMALVIDELFVNMTLSRSMLDDDVVSPKHFVILANSSGSITRKEVLQEQNGQGKFDNPIGHHLSVP